MKAFLAKYWPLLVTLLGALSPSLSPTVSAFWTGHPQAVAVIAGVYAAVKFLLPSPLQTK
jgi:hypothetical protein